MKLHIIVLSLTLVATAAHADLFDRLKEMKDDFSEIKETIEEIGGEDEAESETAAKTTVPENSASTSQQGITASAPTASKPPSEPGNAGSSTGQNMYGWLTAVGYDRRGNPQYPRTRVSLRVSGVTTARSTGIPCNLLFLNRSLPQIDGISVGDFDGKSDGEINQAFVPHRGRFVRLNDVQVHRQQNQRFCVANSVAVVQDFAKANVTFSEVKGHYLSTVVNAAIRAGDLLSPTVAPDTIYRPDEYECKFYRWASTEAAQAWYGEYQQSGYPRPNSFRMEFVGVRPADEIGYCEFDTMNIVANEAEAPAVAQPTQSNDVERSTGETLQADQAEDEVVLDAKAMLEECQRIGHRRCVRVCFRAASLERSSDLDDCRAAYNKVKSP